MPHLPTLAHELSSPFGHTPRHEIARDLPKKIRMTIPTQWCPPLHDEDGYLHPKINPYDRYLIFPHPDVKLEEAPNLLDIAEASFRTGGSVTPREAVSPTGQGFLDLARKVLLSEIPETPRVQVTEVVILDQRRFLQGRPCDVRIELALVK